MFMSRKIITDPRCWVWRVSGVHGFKAKPGPQAEAVASVWFEGETLNSLEPE